MTLKSIARALNGTVNGDQVLAPGPNHSPRDRSLSVWIDHGSPDGFQVHSFAGDDWWVCRDHVRERLGLSPCAAGLGMSRGLQIQLLLSSWSLPATTSVSGSSKHKPSGKKVCLWPAPSPMHTSVIAACSHRLRSKLRMSFDFIPLARFASRMG